MESLLERDERLAATTGGGNTGMWASISASVAARQMGDTGVDSHAGGVEGEGVLSVTQAERAEISVEKQRQLLGKMLGDVRRDTIARYGSVRNLFQKLDVDGGGGIDRTEFAETLEKHGLARNDGTGTAMTDDEREMLFDCMDTNNSNTVDFAELSTHSLTSIATFCYSVDFWSGASVRKSFRA